MTSLLASRIDRLIAAQGRALARPFDDRNALVRITSAEAVRSGVGGDARGYSEGALSRSRSCIEGFGISAAIWHDQLLDRLCADDPSLGEDLALVRPWVVNRSRCRRAASRRALCELRGTMTVCLDTVKGREHEIHVSPTIFADLRMDYTARAPPS